MKNKSSIVFTGDIGFDRYMYGKWNDEQLISDEILDFLHSADHVVANVEGPVAPVETNTTKDGVQQLLHTIDPEAVDPDDVEMLEDLIVAAIGEAMNQAEAATSESMKKITGGMNIPGMF